MSQQPAAQFERVTSRRTWRIVVFLLMLFLLTLVLASWAVVTLWMGGGTKWFQAGECAKDHILPAAQAAERYYRDKGSYPARIEDVYPVYLTRQDVLYCPSDPAKHPGVSSFQYTRPDPRHPDAPILVCNHHGPLVLTVVRQGPVEPGHTEWVVRLLPRAEPASAK